MHSESLLKKLIDPGTITNVLLCDINLTVRHGETLGIVGESGSGKSLTVKSILGLLNFDPGIIQGDILFSSGIDAQILEKSVFNPSRKTRFWGRRRTMQFRWHTSISQKIKIPPSIKADSKIRLTFYNHRGKYESVTFNSNEVDSNSYLSIEFPTTFTHCIVTTHIEIPWKYNLNQDIERAFKNYKKKGLIVRGQEISMIFQDPKTFLTPHWSILRQIKNLQTLFKLQVVSDLDVDREGDVLDIEQDLLDLGLSDRRILKSKIGDLSGGQVQRIMILLSNIGKPTLVIADEPTTGLDVTLKREIVERVLNQSKTSMIFISHDMNMVRRISHRINIMFKGEIIENCASPLFLSKHSHHPYATDLLNIHDTHYSEYIKEDTSAGNSDNDGCNYYRYGCKLRKEGLCNIISPPPFDVELKEIVGEDVLDRHWIKCWEFSESEC